MPLTKGRDGAPRRGTPTKGRMGFHEGVVIYIAQVKMINKLGQTSKTNKKHENWKAYVQTGLLVDEILIARMDQVNE